MKQLLASLVAQWSRICLSVQKTQVLSPVQEDPACHRAPKPECRSCWACALGPGIVTPESVCCNCWGPRALKPVLPNKRGHNSEKPLHCNREQSSLAATREKPSKQRKSSVAKNKYRNKFFFLNKIKWNIFLSLFHTEFSGMRTTVGRNPFLLQRHIFKAWVKLHRVRVCHLTSRS